MKYKLNTEIVIAFLNKEDNTITSFNLIPKGAIVDSSEPLRYQHKNVKRQLYAIKDKKNETLYIDSKLINNEIFTRL